jgi:hypothetical protein
MQQKAGISACPSPIHYSLPYFNLSATISATSLPFIASVLQADREASASLII